MNIDIQLNFDDIEINIDIHFNFDSQLCVQDYDNAVTHFETALRVAQERADDNAEKSLQTALGVLTLTHTAASCQMSHPHASPSGRQKRPTAMTILRMLVHSSLP